MEKRTIYILKEKEEITTVKNCLNYMLHRYREHGKCYVDIKVLEKLRRDFEII